MIFYLKVERDISQICLYLVLVGKTALFAAKISPSGKVTKQDGFLNPVPEKWILQVTRVWDGPLETVWRAGRGGEFEPQEGRSMNMF